MFSLGLMRLRDSFSTRMHSSSVHQEEIDLCWRINARGREVAVVPSSVVYHLGGGTLSMQDARKTYLNFRNNHFLLYKNLSTGRWMVLSVIRFFLDYMAAFSFLLQGKLQDAKAVVKARIDFLYKEVIYEN